jgi:hypothetical protein
MDSPREQKYKEINGLPNKSKDGRPLRWIAQVHP